MFPCNLQLRFIFVLVIFFLTYIVGVANSETCQDLRSKLYGEEYIPNYAIKGTTLTFNSPDRFEVDFLRVRIKFNGSTKAFVCKTSGTFSISKNQSIYFELPCLSKLYTIRVEYNMNNCPLDNPEGMCKFQSTCPESYSKNITLDVGKYLDLSSKLPECNNTLVSTDRVCKSLDKYPESVNEAITLDVGKYLNLSSKLPECNNTDGCTKTIPSKNDKRLKRNDDLWGIFMPLFIVLGSLFLIFALLESFACWKSNSRKLKLRSLSRDKDFLQLVSGAVRGELISDDDSSDWNTNDGYFSSLESIPEKSNIENKKSTDISIPIPDQDEKYNDRKYEITTISDIVIHDDNNDNVPNDIDDSKPKIVQFNEKQDTTAV